ncbi:class E sortase [Streptomyces resistomycificus]|uniref:Sortase n=1 Tax=Streptomyces resistomycificus TaxID=67356 RepID=A0A0L8LEJ4_9ACTN|nr:class E sortase [Streptomyces resistomycificus]KOG36476.1 sortase [Streptomyces resistomycificus]KUN92404.1 sortase [Streptomyces resistomycificus]
MRIPVVRHSSRRRRARWRRVVWVAGETLVTVGVVLLLLVVHQVWWTNREAKEGAEREVWALERQWGEGGVESGGGGADPPDAGDPRTAVESGTTVPSASPDGSPGVARPRSGTGDGTARPDWSRAYAILTIPRLDLRVPVAEGTSRSRVLDKGYVGHYRGTGQPGQAGNFALAGHRNTHGEPFRYINRLRPKDTVEVETGSAVYTYVVDRTLPRTSATDTSVIRPVPHSTVHPSRGYTDPGYYLTLTTCTPEYTSRYRLVVWGRLVSMRPR